MKDDSNKVNLLNDVSFTYFTIDPAEGVRIGDQAKSLAEKIGWEKGVARALHSLGSNYWASHQLLKAQDYYWQALRLSEKLAEKKDIARSLHALATTYETQYNYPKALQYYKKTLYIQEVLNDTFGRLGSLANIANVYEVQHNYDEALDYFMQSLKLCVVYGNERHIAYMSGRIGNIYALKGDYSNALAFEYRALDTLRKFPNLYDIATVLNSIGQVYEQQQHYRKALNYYQQAYQEVQSASGTWCRAYLGKCAGKIGSAYLLIATTGHLSRDGDVNRHLLGLSLQYLKKGLQISASVNDQESLRNIYQSLSTAQSLSGQKDEALESYRQYVLYKDSLAGADRDREMTRHELEYEYGKQTDSLSYVNKLQQSRMSLLEREKKLARLTVKQQWLYGITGIMILIVVAAFFIFRYHHRQLKLKNELSREKTEKQLQDAEHQREINDITFAALRSQMNPHFIFNALNTIQSYVYTNDKKSATSYLGKFSELIRKILEYSNRQQISLADEIHLLRLYIDIEKARFGDNFHASMEIDPTLDTENIFIAPMLVQPYAENAIKHGLLHQSGQKKLLVRFNKSKDNQYTEIMIDDNGVGREKSSEINKKRVDHKSFANSANEKRIALINLVNDKKTKLQIIDKKNADGSAAGTTVIISIPLIYETNIADTHHH